MKIEEILFHLKLSGWCVLDGIIPEDEVEDVKESIVLSAENQVAGQKDSEGRGQAQGAEVYDTSGSEVAIRNLINVNQSFARYLSDKRILDSAKVLFGPYIRMRTGKGFVDYPGCKRGNLHGDGPFNQRSPVCVFAPYQDAVMQLTTVWMFSPFTKDNGGTILVPGSHRSENNWTGGLDIEQPYPGEVQATGPAGSVVLFDSRLWHTNGANNSTDPRVGMIMTYFPWWLSQVPAMPPGTPERNSLMEETGLNNDELGPGTNLIPVEVYKGLPEDVKPLFRHWVQR